MVYIKDTFYSYKQYASGKKTLQTYTLEWRFKNPWRQGKDRTLKLEATIQLKYLVTWRIWDPVTRSDLHEVTQSGYALNESGSENIDSETSSSNTIVVP